MRDLIETWWLYVLRGLAACVFGVLLLARPGPSLLLLVLVFGAYAIIEGAFVLYAGLVGRGPGEHSILTAAAGAVSIVAGIVTLMWPGITTFALFLVIASWAIVLGVLQVIAAVRLSNAIKGEWLLAVSGILSVILGVFMLANPLIGIAVVLGVLAAYAFLFGIVNLVLGFRLRGWSQTILPGG
jgi:uncharacterized membrane protein HdeD (DUF308 family)